MNYKKLLSYLPLAIGLVILVAGAAFVPWREVWPYFTDLSVIDYLLIIGLGFAFYLTRILRYSYILSTFNQVVSHRRVGLSYLIGQPISILPGGEFYRSVLLKKHADVSMRNGLPTVFVQSLTEGLGLVILALIGALIIGKYVLLVGAVAIFYTLVMLLIQLQASGRRSHKIINKVPFVNVSRRMLRMFFKKNKQAMSGYSLVILLVSSFASTLVLIITILIAANSFNIEMSFTEAMIVISLPLILQYASLIPGGLGISEQGSVGIMLLMQIPLPAAVALTLVVRFVSLWFGLLLGVAAISYTKLSKTEKS